MTGELRELVGVYEKFFYDGISCERAMDIIGENRWGRVSRVAAFELSDEGAQPVSDDELAEKYGSR